MSTQVNPQAGPAIVLAQLLTEHPELHRLGWRLSPNGGLIGSDMRMDADPRPVMAEFIAVLGGKPLDVLTSAGDFASWLPTAWRDVQVSISLGCPAGVLAPLVSAVAA